VEKYAYTLYGKPAAASTVGNPYMYTGRRLDAETGLYYYRARYYDPHLRRFIETDPIGYAGGMNLYAYAGNSPVNWIDPWGLDAAALTMSLDTWYILEAMTPALAYANAIGGTVAVGLGSYHVTSCIIEDTWVGRGGIGEWAYDYDYSHPQKINGVTYPMFPLTGSGVPVIPPIFFKGKGNRNDLPAKGQPNSSDVKDQGSGRGQIRDYGSDGRAKTDYDFGHNHGGGDPHAHDWDWSKTPPRQPGRPLKPGE
jgi:RHS repeat-associated protein